VISNPSPSVCAYQSKMSGDTAVAENCNMSSIKLIRTHCYEINAGDVEISVNQRYADVCVSLQAIALHSFDGNIFLRIRKNCPSLKHTYPGSDIFAMLEYTSDHEEKHLK